MTCQSWKSNWPPFGPLFTKWKSKRKAIFSDLQLSHVKYLQPLDLWWWIIAHLKALCHICLHLSQKSIVALLRYETIAQTYPIHVLLKYCSKVSIEHHCTPHSGNATPTLPVPPNAINVFLLLLLLWLPITRKRLSNARLLWKIYPCEWIIRTRLCKARQRKKMYPRKWNDGIFIFGSYASNYGIFANFISRVIFY